MNKKLTVALAGNPNSGKTTIFNALTGARQHVGNYPGVTVEKKEGRCRYKDTDITVVDLPGTYSLTAYSIEELAARHFIINEHPDVVIAIVDSSNLERNLYLVTQLIEMKVPLLLAFNMSDIAKRKGIEFDIPQLSLLLGTPIVEVVGNKKVGIDEMLASVLAMTEQGPHSLVQINYGHEIEEELSKISRIVNQEHNLVSKYGLRWLALKLLEYDEEIVKQDHAAEVLEQVTASRNHLQNVFGDEPEIILADRRYGFISGACQEAVKHTVESRHDISDKIDAVATHPFLGLLIFGVLMYFVFMVTFRVGKYPVAGLEILFEWFAHTVNNHWPTGPESLLRSLLVDGIIEGVGGVVVFLPNILLLFLAIAFLEDTGYMARAAFIMDRIMHKIGLHGKSFIPMIIGFGCSIPAILSTRILENRRNRLTTILVIPLMSCGARLPIYTLIIPAFFAAKWQGPILWIIYVIGILLAILSAKLLRKTLFKGETIPFVMELPPYRFPTVKGLLIHMWERGKEYLKKAGTVILAASVILWAVTTFPKPDKDSFPEQAEVSRSEYEIQHSFAGRFGTALEPLLKPIGFDWKIGTALVGAFAAKEIFVSQMSIIYAVEEHQDVRTTESLRNHLREDYSALQGFCIMLFCLISTPCIATIAVTKKETGSWKWAVFQLAGLTGMAYCITFTVYTIGRLFVGG